MREKIRKFVRDSRRSFKAPVVENTTCAVVKNNRGHSWVNMVNVVKNTIRKLLKSLAFQRCLCYTRDKSKDKNKN